MSEPESTTGRPGISLEQARTAAQTWLARTGRLPTIRELRSALGDTGSLSTIGRHLQTIRAERLTEGESPDKGSAEEIALKAMSAALKVVAGEAADAAETMVADAERTADKRVEAAVALQRKAEAHSAQMQQEREHALGQVKELRERIHELQKRLKDQQTALDKAQKQEKTLSKNVSKLEHTLDSVRTERDQVTEDREALQSEMAALRRVHEQTREELAGTRATSEALEKRATDAETERDRLLADQASRWDLILERLPE